MYFANGGEATSLFRYAEQGDLRFYQRGVTTRLVPDDGSPGWRELDQRARQEPVKEEGN